MKALPGSLWLWVILPLFDIVKPDRTLDALMSPLLSTPMLLRVFFFFFTRGCLCSSSCLVDFFFFVYDAALQALRLLMPVIFRETAERLPSAAA